MKRGVLLCLFLVSTSSLCSPGKSIARAGAAEAMSPEEIFNRVSPSVFVVEAHNCSISDDKVIAIGSGVAVGPDAIVTNLHVIAAGGCWKVRHGGNSWDAHIAWLDPNHDLALLRATGLHAPTVSLRTSPAVAVGERVFAIGAPEGLELTLSEGIVSGLRQYQDSYVIQTSAPVSPGSSGGGLFDQRGRLVGITSFGLVEGENLNFALPAEWVGAFPKHTGREPLITPLPPEYKQVFSEADNVDGNLLTFEIAAETHGDGVFSHSVAKGTDEAAGSMLLFNCLPNPQTRDCPQTWPAWQRAALYMLELRAAIHAARPFTAQPVQMFCGEARTVWANALQVYCRERPGGLYTDLGDNMLACPAAP